MKIPRAAPHCSSQMAIHGSKSYANRALIKGAVLKRPYTIKNLPRARDTLSLMSCLKQIGLQIQTRGNNQLTLSNSFPECELPSTEPMVLHTGDGGTTNRFLIPLLALGKKYIPPLPSGADVKPAHGRIPTASQWLWDQRLLF